VPISDLVSITTLIALAVVFALIYRKLIGITSEVKHTREILAAELERSEFRLYRQIEALQALTSLLGLRKPLPAMRGWAGSPDFLLEVCQEVLHRRPDRIVECSSGVSTLIAARCCQLNGAGHVFSLENAPEFAHKTRQLLEREGLQEWATVIDAPLIQHSRGGMAYKWYTLDRLPPGPIDMLVVDGPLGKLNQQARYPAGPLLFPSLSDSALIIVDDANRPDERRIVERWQQQFPKLRLEQRDAEKGLVLLEAMS
jgi:hypothetical protein